MGIKDIHARLQAGAISIGMYHTAGKGTRLAPLPGAENNNKPGVKLPALLKVVGSQAACWPVTIPANYLGAPSERLVSTIPLENVERSRVSLQRSEYQPGPGCTSSLR